jgi:transcriptional regulator with XRE-family HTH domain
MERRQFMTVGERIRDYRTRMNYTLDDVAQKVGVSAPTVQRYESGEIDGIPFQKIELLARVFNIPPSILVGWESEKKDTTKQVEGFVAKQKAMILSEKEEIRRNILMAMWSAFLNGLKLSSAISSKEYNKYYDEMQNFEKEINKHEKIKKSTPNVVITGYGYELQGRCQAK